MLTRLHLLDLLNIKKIRWFMCCRSIGANCNCLYPDEWHWYDMRIL